MSFMATAVVRLAGFPVTVTVYRTGEVWCANGDFLSLLMFKEGKFVSD